MYRFLLFVIIACVLSFGSLLFVSSLFVVCCALFVAGCLFAVCCQLLGVCDCLLMLPLFVVRC